jgi:hypothetical protein
MGFLLIDVVDPEFRGATRCRNTAIALLANALAIERMLDE